MSMPRGGYNSGKPTAGAESRNPPIPPRPEMGSSMPATETTTSRPEAPPAPAPAPPIPQRILVVEDHDDARSSLQQLLRMALGAEVDVAEDGAKGLEMLQARPYSLVITDLRMPKVGGMKLIEEVQSRRLPVTTI